MENYFNWRTRTKSPLKKRKWIQHQKQDLRPDWWQERCPCKRAASGSTIQFEWRDRMLISSFKFFLISWVCPVHVPCAIVQHFVDHTGIALMWSFLVWAHMTVPPWFVA
jgi:hypothetical protein